LQINKHLMINILQIIYICCTTVQKSTFYKLKKQAKIYCIKFRKLERMKTVPKLNNEYGTSSDLDTLKINNKTLSDNHP
jgi:hypothetical protein